MFVRFTAVEVYVCIHWSHWGKRSTPCSQINCISRTTLSRNTDQAKRHTPSIFWKWWLTQGGLPKIKWQNDFWHTWLCGRFFWWQQALTWRLLVPAWCRIHRSTTARLTLLLWRGWRRCFNQTQCPVSTRWTLRKNLRWPRRQESFSRRGAWWQRAPRLCVVWTSDLKRRTWWLAEWCPGRPTSIYVTTSHLGPNLASARRKASGYSTVRAVPVRSSTARGGDSVQRTRLWVTLASGKPV